MKTCELHNVKLLYIPQLWLNFTTQENIVLFAEPHLSAQLNYRLVFYICVSHMKCDAYD